MREHLLGYLLRALDDDERQQVEAALADNAELRQELESLRKQLAALRDGTVYEPPASLAERTCESVAAYDESHAVAPARRWSFGANGTATTRRDWSVGDLMAVAAICIAALLLFIPALGYSQFQARLSSCQNNLRQLGIALRTYNDHYKDYFPPVPPRGKLSVAGSYALTLNEKEYVTNPAVYYCPASPQYEQYGTIALPTREEVQRADGCELTLLQERLGGSFAYSLGYVEDGQLFPTRNLGRSNFPIMSDSPSPNLNYRRSANHDGRGQNVLYEDFHVRFVPDCAGERSYDPFFVNREGNIAAGVDREDAVVGSSGTSPLGSSRTAPQGFGSR